MQISIPLKLPCFLTWVLLSNTILKELCVNLNKNITPKYLTKRMYLNGYVYTHRYIILFSSYLHILSKLFTWAYKNKNNLF